MVIVLVHVVVAQRLGLQRGAPHKVPISAICLLEASPAKRVDHTVVGVHTIRNLKLQLELVLLHLENMVFLDLPVVVFDLLVAVSYARWICEVDCWWAPCEGTLAQIDGPLLVERVCRIVGVSSLLRFKDLSCYRVDGFVIDQYPVASIEHLILICGRLCVALIAAFDRHVSQARIQAFNALEDAWSLVQLPHQVLLRARVR